MEYLIDFKSIRYNITNFKQLSKTITQANQEVAKSEEEGVDRMCRAKLSGDLPSRSRGECLETGYGGGRRGRARRRRRGVDETKSLVGPLAYLLDVTHAGLVTQKKWSSPLSSVRCSPPPREHRD